MNATTSQKRNNGTQFQEEMSQATAKLRELDSKIIELDKRIDEIDSQISECKQEATGREQKGTFFKKKEFDVSKVSSYSRRSDSVLEMSIEAQVSFSLPVPIRRMVRKYMKEKRDDVRGVLSREIDEAINKYLRENFVGRGSLTYSRPYWFPTKMTCQAVFRSAYETRPRRLGQLHKMQEKLKKERRAVQDSWNEARLSFRRNWGPFFFPWFPPY